MGVNSKSNILMSYKCASNYEFYVYKTGFYRWAIDSMMFANGFTFCLFLPKIRARRIRFVRNRCKIE